MRGRQRVEAGVDRISRQRAGLQRIEGRLLRERLIEIEDGGQWLLRTHGIERLWHRRGIGHRSIRVRVRVRTRRGSLGRREGIHEEALLRIGAALVCITRIHGIIMIRRCHWRRAADGGRLRVQAHKGGSWWGTSWGAGDTAGSR